MISLDQRARRLIADLRANGNDLNFQFEPGKVLVRENGGPLQEYPRSKVHRIEIRPHGGSSTVAVEDQGGNIAPQINIGEGTGDVLIYGLKRPVCTAAGNVRAFSASDPETLEHLGETIADFHRTSRAKKNWFQRAQEAVISFFASDIKIGKDPGKQLLKTLSDIIHGRHLRRVLAELDVWRSRSDISESMLERIKEKLQPGDVLLRFKRGFPLDRLVVGAWQHAGVCINRGAAILDATLTGVEKHTLEHFAQADGIAILRLPFSSHQRGEFLSYILAQLGRAYNFDFSSSRREHYCSGLIYRALEQIGLVEPARNIVHPDHLLEIPGSQLVWTNRPDLVASALRMPRAAREKARAA